MDSGCNGAIYSKNDRLVSEDEFMRKILMIIRQELIKTFSRPSFLIVAIGIPLLGVLILGGVKVIQNRSADADATSETPADEWQMDIEGYIDQSGLIQIIPPDLPEGHLLSYPNEDQAKEALASGEISAYYIIPADFIDEGEVYYVFPESRSLVDDGQKWVMRWTLLVNLQGGDLELAGRIWNPVGKLDERVVTSSAEVVDMDDRDECARPGSACQSNDLVRYIPSIMAALFYISFMFSSTMLFSSIGTEKENRTLEVLLLSISPRQLLTGKTIGLGISGIIQTLVWLGAVFTIFNLGGSTISLPDNFSFPIDILVWSLIFFLCGFGVYASLMAGAGALAPKMKDAGAANFIAMSPLLLGYIVGILAPLADSAEAALPIILSFFPLTSPIVMVMRLTNSIVPLWQLLLSAVLLIATNVLVNRATASLFHAQNLLSGQPFSIKRYFKLLFGRA
jgi:ABC-2 type transport system permease protein